MSYTALLFSLLLIFSPVQSDEEIKAQLQQKLVAYEAAIKSKDIEGLLDMFGPDGAYGNAKTRHEIRMGLTSYLRNEIIDFSMFTDKISVTPSLANHMGKFNQELIMNGFKKKNSGKFRIVWYKYADGWKIQYLSMEPDTSN